MTLQATRYLVSLHRRGPGSWIWALGAQIPNPLMTGVSPAEMVIRIGTTASGCGNLQVQVMMMDGLSIDCRGDNRLLNPGGSTHSCA